MKYANDKLEEVIERALRDGTDYDPNGVDSIVGRIVDALTYGNAVTGRIGWLVSYGKVHEVTGTDFEDSTGDGHIWRVWTRAVPDDEDEGDDE